MIQDIFRRIDEIIILHCSCYTIYINKQGWALTSQKVKKLI